ncbi:MAG TPA: hypothetical protein VFQ53_14360 [Kofleriaceae bacterium]|nr:hypothetical protein [Kofleriaceae bacterium]
MAKLPVYGAFERVAMIAGSFDGEVHDPLRRFAGSRRGEALELVELETGTVTTRVGGVDPRARVRIDPTGTRVVVRHEAALAIHDARGVIAEAATPTVRVAWNGERLAPGAPRPQWGYALDEVGFTHDGTHVWLATHGEADGRACLQLYDRELALVDTFTDLRSYSPYSVAEGEDFAPLGVWSEAWIEPQPADPAWALAVSNAGDSCSAVIAFRVAEGRFVVDQEPLQRAVFAIDAHALRGVFVTPVTPEPELLIVDGDHLLSLTSWPPTTPPRLDAVDPLEALRDDDHRVVIPFARGGELEHGDVYVTDRELLVGLVGESASGYVALDLRTLAVLGVVNNPRGGDVLHVGHDRYITTHARGATLWRLARR